MKTAARLALSCILALLALSLLVLGLQVRAALAATNTDAPPLCLPAPIGAGGVARVGVSANGQWIWWACRRADNSVQMVRYLGTRAVTLRAVGDRFDTILRSSDPLAAAQTAHRRYATVSATDPSLAAVYADYIASLSLP
jgi:hypothetical protein